MFSISTLRKSDRYFVESFSLGFPQQTEQRRGGAARVLDPLRGAPVDGPESGPFPAVRTSSGRAPNDRACLALAAPATPASHPTDEDLSAGTPLSHHRSTRSALSASGCVFSFASLQGERKKRPHRADRSKNNGISKQQQQQQRLHRQQWHSQHQCQQHGFRQ